MSIFLINGTVSEPASNPSTLANAFMILTPYANTYLQYRVAGKNKQPYLYVMDEHMCLYDDKSSAKRVHELALRVRTILLSHLQELVSLLEKGEKLADTVAELLLTHTPSLARFFSGSQSGSRASSFLDTQHQPILPSELTSYYPASPIENYAFLTGHLPCLIYEKHGFRFCTESEASLHRNGYYLFYIDVAPFRSLFTCTLDLAFVDKTLTLLRALTEPRVVAPAPIRAGVTLDAIRKFLRETVILVCKRYPAKVAAYYPLLETPTPYQQVILQTRHAACLRYKQEILAQGRPVKLRKYSELAYLDRTSCEEEIADLFLKLGIEPFDTSVVALDKLKRAAPGYLVKLANLLRRRLIWRRGKDTKLLPRFLHTAPTWWFDGKAAQLPELAKQFFLPRIKVALQRYIEPPLFEIVSAGYQCIDLSLILKPLQWQHSAVRQIQKQLTNQDTPLDSAGLSFMKCIFTRWTKSSTPLSNYQAWLEAIYNGQDEDFLVGKECLAQRRASLPARSTLLSYSAKGAQRLLLYQCFGTALTAVRDPPL